MTTTRTAVCVPCRHAAEHGWWGTDPAPSHCDRCHRSWSSLDEGHCDGCCGHFDDDDAFDAHLYRRGGDVHCYDPHTVREHNGRKTFTTLDTAFGPVWTLTDNARANRSGA